MVSIPFFRRRRGRLKFTVPLEVCDDDIFSSLCMCRVLAQGVGIIGNTSSADLLAFPHLWVLSLRIPFFILLSHGLTPGGCPFQCNSIFT